MRNTAISILQYPATTSRAQQARQLEWRRNSCQDIGLCVTKTNILELIMLFATFNIEYHKKKKKLFNYEKIS